MDSEERRRHKRYSIAWSIEVTASEWRDVFDLTTGDISRGGLFVRSARPVELGSRIAIHVHLPDGTSLNIEGEVVRQAGASSEPGFGVKFDEKHSIDLTLLESMAASYAGGPNVYQLDEMTLPAMLVSMLDGSTQMTSIHRRRADESERPDLETMLDDAGGAVEVEIDLSDFHQQRPRRDKKGGSLDTAEYPADFEPGQERTPVNARADQSTREHFDPSLVEETGASIEKRDEAPTCTTLEPTGADFGAVAAKSDDDLPAVADSAMEERSAQPTAGNLQGVDDGLDEPPDLPDDDETDEADEPQSVTGRPTVRRAAITRGGAAGELREEDSHQPAPPASSPVAGWQIDPESCIFGIDFGTSYSSIAIVAGEQAAILPDESGHTLTPTAVYYPERGEPVVGWRARERQMLDPRNTFTSPKRLLGKRYDDRVVEAFLAQMAVPTSAGPNGQIIGQVHGQPVSIPQIAAEVLRRMAWIGRKSTGVDVRRVLIASPVAHGEEERDALRRAAQLAGLELIGILDEPFAATVAYGMAGADNETIAVFDFGGGTFDFTLARIENRRFRVLGEAGDPWLGGDDFDLVIADHAASVFEREHGVDLRKRQVEWQQLVFLCERVKRRLSSEQSTELMAKGLVRTHAGPIDLVVPFDREQLNMLCGELVERALEAVDSCLELSDVKPQDVDQVVLTGGVTRIPLVRQRLQEYFEREIQLTVSPDHAIVLGNAIYGAFLMASARQKAPA